MAWLIHVCQDVRNGVFHKTITKDRFTRKKDREVVLGPLACAGQYSSKPSGYWIHWHVSAVRSRSFGIWATLSKTCFYRAAFDSRGVNDCCFDKVHETQRAHQVSKANAEKLDAILCGQRICDFRPKFRVRAGPRSGTYGAINSVETARSEFLLGD